MTVLSSLVTAYGRLLDAPPFGYSAEKIGVVVGLNEDGSVASVTDWREGEGRKRQPRPMQVPQPVKRTAGIAPNFLWDKTSYVLGVTAGEGKRTAEEHREFVERHAEEIGESDDPGLRALVLFLKSWTPDQFVPPLWSEELKDQNVVFALESERRSNTFLHDRPAAKALWTRVSAGGDRNSEICLVTGERGTVARLHPSIKGVWGAQSSGAALVSFNLDAFTSYGHEQGDNAPVSEAAAFAYTTALNRFLERDSGHRIQIGDASTVFWADASEMVAEEAEIWGAFMLGVPLRSETDDRYATRQIGAKLDQIAKGAHLEEIEPRLAKGVRFCVLALAPNAARLSIRFFFQDDFGVLTKNYAAYLRDIAFEPWPHGRARPTIERCSLRTAPARIDRTESVVFDKEQRSPLLSGELLRAVITGNRFPTALLGLLLMRVRSDHVLDSVRIALIKAIIVRAMRLERRLPTGPDGNPNEEYLMRTDPNDPNPARRLGRLFAVIERAQLAALGDEVNATVKDKFLSSAAATPRQVFPGILKNAQNHTRKLRNGHSDADWIKDSGHARRVGAALDRDIGRLVSTFNDGFPLQHSDEEQGLFLVGYYQERFGGQADPETDSSESPSSDNEE